MNLVAKLVALSASLALTSSLTLTSTPSVGLAPPQARTPQGTYQKQIHEVTDKKRVKHGRAKLRSQRCVQRYAVRQAARMARQERMFHQRLGPILRGCDLSAVGENVAYGYPSGRAVVGAWMRSPGHRANLLSGTFRLLGAGARQSDDGTWYAAQVFGRR